MADPARDRLPLVKDGLMISLVSYSRHLVTVAGVLTALVASLWPCSSSAQSAPDSGWFDPATQTTVPSAPAPAPTVERQSLPPSPLLADEQADEEEDRDPRALTAWNSQLDPYGAWADDPTYGRVWMPHTRVVGADFAPYVSSGRWALDENEDWVWVSDYAFGGVVFHYGRWVWISGRGWAWIPGLRYAPAWVAWRVPTSSYAYVGWAPLPPAYIWFGGSAVVYGYGPLYPWVFCPSDYVFSYHVHSYVLHDHGRVAYAARYTRPYRTAPPRGGYVRAVPRGPSVRTAQVPVRAVPRERVSSRLVAARSPVAPSRLESANRRERLERSDVVDRRERLDRPGLVDRRDSVERRDAPARRDTVERRDSTIRRERLAPSDSAARRERPHYETARPERSRPSVDRSPRPVERSRPERSAPRSSGSSHRRK